MCLTLNPGRTAAQIAWESVRGMCGTQLLPASAAIGRSSLGAWAPPSSKSRHRNRLVYTGFMAPKDWGAYTYRLYIHHCTAYRCCFPFSSFTFSHHLLWFPICLVVNSLCNISLFHLCSRYSDLKKLEGDFLPASRRSGPAPTALVVQ